MDVIDISAGVPPRTASPLPGRVFDGLVAVAPSTPAPAPSRRWPRIQTFAVIVMASLAGWAALIAIAVKIF